MEQQFARQQQTQQQPQQPQVIVMPPQYAQPPPPQQQDQQQGGSSLSPELQADPAIRNAHMRCVTQRMEGVITIARGHPG